MIAGLVFFLIALLCIVLRVAYQIRWNKGLDRHLGEWFYDAELDMTFWRYFDEIEEILAELNREFPGIRAERSASEEGK